MCRSTRCSRSRHSTKTRFMSCVIDEDTVHELRNRARDALLTMAIANEEKVEGVALDLKSLEGMTDELYSKLEEHQIRTRDDLAELAVDELVEMTGIEEDAAKALI